MIEYHNKGQGFSAIWDPAEGLGAFVADFDPHGYFDIDLEVVGPFLVIKDGKKTIKTLSPGDSFTITKVEMT